MKVLFVINSIYVRGNGLNTSARTTIGNLKKAGVDVRVLSMKNLEPGGPQPDYPLEQFRFPLLQNFITEHGYSFASSDNRVIEEAVAWADVLHLEEFFVLQWRAIRVARRLGKPCVGTYHLHPENITAAFGIHHLKGFNNFLLKMFRNIVLDKCTDIQCPTLNVQKRLESMGFKARLHLISNGIVTDVPEMREEMQTNPYLIVCIGRLCNEKDQYTLLRAIRHCRHASEIQLHFAGQGPRYNRMKKMADQLYTDGVVKYEPEFVFHTQEELRHLAAKAYLAVHCADIEVEGLSILEAMRDGAVPVIADSSLSAASQFALDDRSRFHVYDDRELAEKIDWWIEHPEERAVMGERYRESVKQYDVNISIEKLIEMYNQSMQGSR